MRIDYSAPSILFKLNLWWWEGWQGCPDKFYQVVTVIYIADIEVVFGSGIRRAEVNLFENCSAGFRYFNVEVAITDKSKDDTVTVDAVVSHHLSDSNISGTGALIYNILNKVCVAGH